MVSKMLIKIASLCGRSTLITLFFLCALAAVYCCYVTPPTWGKFFGMVDDRCYYGPNAFFLDASLRNGEFPLWNPLTYCGLPFAADPQSNACYPFHILRSYLTPSFNPYATVLSMKILVLLHILLGCFGAYLLAKSYALSRWASMTAAVIFMLNPYSIIYNTEFYVFPLITAWIPWVLLSAHYTFTARGMRQTLLYMTGTIVCFTLSTLGAFPQLSLYMGLILCSYALLDVLFHLRRAPSEAPGTTEENLHLTFSFKVWRTIKNTSISIWRKIRNRTLILGAICVLTILASSVLLLPAFEFGRFSARTAAAGLEVTAWPQNHEWFHLLKCLVIFPGNTWLPQGCRAAGIGSLLALLLAFSHHRKRDVFVFFVLYLIMTDLTLGAPFPLSGLLRRVDFLNITVSPWRAGCFSSLPLAILAAFGVDAIAATPKRKILGLLRSVFAVLSGGGLLALLLYWLSDEPLFKPWFLVWLLPVLTLVGIVIFSWKKKPALATPLLSLLIAFEVIIWGAQMLPEYTEKRLSNNVDARSFGENTQISLSNRRDANTRPNWQMWTLNSSLLGYSPLYVGATRELLCKPGQETKYRGYLKREEAVVENQRGNLLVKRHFWLARHWLPGPLPEKEHLFPVTTTVFLPNMPESELLAGFIPWPNRAVSDHGERIDLGAGKALNAQIKSSGSNNMTLRLPPFDQAYTHCVLYVGYIGTNLVDFRPICQDEDGTVYHLARSRSINSHSKENFLEIPLPDLNTNTITLKWPQKTNYRIQLTEAYVLKDLADENDLISINARSANSVDLTISNLPGPRILTFLDSAYPGWHAWINDDEVEILRANNAFKAIVLPAGTHRVRFEFKPLSFYLGLAITTGVSCILLLILLMLFLWTLWERLTTSAGKKKRHSIQPKCGTEQPVSTVLSPAEGDAGEEGRDYRPLICVSANEPVDEVTATSTPLPQLAAGETLNKNVNDIAEDEKRDNTP